MHWKVVGVNTVETLKFENGGECMTPSPPSSYDGAAPPLLIGNILELLKQQMETKITEQYF